MKGSMIKCLQCNTVSVYGTDHSGDRCPVCNGYAIPQGECNIVEEHAEMITLYGDGEAIETICTQVSKGS